MQPHLEPKPNHEVSRDGIRGELPATYCLSQHGQTIIHRHQILSFSLRVSLSRFIIDLLSSTWKEMLL